MRALNPRMSVGSIIGEPITIHRACQRQGQEGEGPEPAPDGGPESLLRQPVPARILRRPTPAASASPAPSPSNPISSSATSRFRPWSLDPGADHQLLQDLQDQFNLTYLFIAHDLSVVRHISDRVAVMYLGHIMELTDRDSIFENPLHPTRRRSCQRFRSRTRPSNASASASSCWAMCRARSGLPRAACSTRVARSPSTSAVRGARVAQRRHGGSRTLGLVPPGVTGPAID